MHMFVLWYQIDLQIKLTRTYEYARNISCSLKGRDHEFNGGWQKRVSTHGDFLASQGAAVDAWSYVCSLLYLSYTTSSISDVRAMVLLMLFSSSNYYWKQKVVKIIQLWISWQFDFYYYYYHRLGRYIYSTRR